MLDVGCLLLLLAPPAFAQDSELPPDRFRSGETTLRAFAPISEATRHSIVKINVNGLTVALGTVVADGGLTLTKASEIKPGKLTCWLATDRQVGAELIAVDEEEDLALLKVHSRNLKPIQWAKGDAVIGQWAITPGIAETPYAVGIISALPHKIRYPRALIGVQFDPGGSKPLIELVVPGLGADKVGLKPGDVIVAVDRLVVTNRQQVVEALRELREGQKAKLRIQRRATQFTVEIPMMVPRAPQLSRESGSGQRRSRLAGELSERADGFEVAIEHDTVLHPWLCGGPLVNLDGQAIGINIARASRVSSYALPSRLAIGSFQQLNSRK